MADPEDPPVDAADLDPRRALLALRVRLRDAGVPAALRARVIRRAGVVLQQDHAVLDEVLREPLRPVDEPHLYEVLLEAAVRSGTVDELDMLLRLGGAPALGVDPVEHGRRVAAMLEVPQAPAAEVRGGAGFGVLEDLFGGDEIPRLGADHGPSARCPACVGFVRLRDTVDRHETRAGVFSRHGLACPRCGATGEVRRYFSRRLRGNRDEVTLRFPGALGPLASRAVCRRGAAWLVGLAVAAAVVEAAVGAGPGGAHLGHLGLALGLRAAVRDPRQSAFLAGAVWATALGLAWSRGGGWWVVAALEAAVPLHAAWAVAARPAGWAEPGG